MSSAAQRRESALTRSARPATLLSIGQVLSRLTPEFPDLSPSKLRFLEDQGLIHPVRTDSGYRKYSPTDLDRLRLVLTLQRDHYLPHKVIRAYLDDIDAGRAPQIPVVSAPVEIVPAPIRRLRREELLRETGAAASLLDDAIATGLFAPAELYGPDIVSLMRELVELRRTGIEPRHLRTLRLNAEREADFIVSALATLIRTPADKLAALERANELAGHLERVRGAIVRTGIQRLGK